MVDVANWQWTNRSARQSDREGTKALYKAILQRKIYGIPDSQSAGEITQYLRTAISMIEEAITSEQPASPGPFANLATAYSLLGFMLSRGDEASPEANQAFLSAVDLGSKAIALYERTTGWGQGTRHDLHVSLAMANFYLERFQEAGLQLSRARGFAGPDAKLEDEALMLAPHIAEINELDAASGSSKAHRTRKGGCLGIALAIAVVVLCVVMLIHLF